MEWLGLIVLLAYPVLWFAWYSVFKWADNMDWYDKSNSKKEDKCT